MTLCATQIPVWTIIYIYLIIPSTVGAMEGTREEFRSFGPFSSQTWGILFAMSDVVTLFIAMGFIQSSCLWIWVCQETGQHLKHNVWRFISAMKDVLVEVGGHDCCVQSGETGLEVLQLWQKLEILQACAQVEKTAHAKRKILKKRWKRKEKLEILQACARVNN